jgi:hypothetical protein
VLRRLAAIANRSGISPRIQGLKLKQEIGMDDDTVIVADFDIVKRKRIAREAILMLLIKSVENPTMTRDHVIDEIDSILDLL